MFGCKEKCRRLYFFNLNECLLCCSGQSVPPPGGAHGTHPPGVTATAWPTAGHLGLLEEPPDPSQGSAPTEDPHPRPEVQWAFWEGGGWPPSRTWGFLGWPEPEAPLRDSSSTVRSATSMPIAGRDDALTYFWPRQGHPSDPLSCRQDSRPPGVATPQGAGPGLWAAVFWANPIPLNLRLRLFKGGYTPRAARPVPPRNSVILGKGLRIFPCPETSPSWGFVSDAK